MAVVTPIIDEDILEDVWDEERLWREEHVREPVPSPFALVIFGATGDLAHRKLIPALYRLCASGLLPDKFAIVGYGRSSHDLNSFRQELRASVTGANVDLTEQGWSTFAEHLHYFQGQYDDQASFQRLAKELNEMDAKEGTENHRLFYLATPPNVYADIVANLGAAKLNKPTQNDGWVRVVVEKPFGRDLESARELDKCMHAAFEESQIYRIDHYLGKETVQNLFVLRFVNGVFEPIWNRNYVDHVQITVAESLGVEERGGYYEEAGATRDMLQSHLLQLLTLTGMEPPSAFTADKVRDEKVKVLDSLEYPDPQHVTEWVVRGQYARGMIDNRRVPGYLDEPGVAPNSTTETFVAAKFLVDNWRWAEVPFYLRTGKRLAKRVSEIAIEFRRAPHMYLPGVSGHVPRRNVLVLRIQPDEGMALRLDVKIPGMGMRIRPVDMSFLYRDAFAGSGPDAYERLLLDAMRGDSTLFARTDEVQAAWRIVTPLLEAFQQQGPDSLKTYPAGSWGPAEADELMARDGRRWRRA